MVKKGGEKELLRSTLACRMYALNKRGRGKALLNSRTSIPGATRSATAAMCDAHSPSAPALRAALISAAADATGSVVLTSVSMVVNLAGGDGDSRNEDGKLHVGTMHSDMGTAICQVVTVIAGQD